MWVFTSFGVLMPSVRPAGTIPAGDDRLIQVRARREKDLRILKAEYLPELGDIIEIPYSDYEYRAYCTHEQWAAALAKISMDIDYTKFKPTTESKYRDPQLHALYNRVWGVFFNTVSTKEHQERYLFGPKGQRGQRGWRARGGRSFTWPNTPALEWKSYDGPGSDEAELLDLVPQSWDDEVPVTRMPNGKIDHSECTHGDSRSAKRRCQRRNQ